MKNHRLLAMLTVVGGWVALSLVLTGCPNSWPDCEDDQECASYNHGTDFCVSAQCKECRNDGDCGDPSMICRNNACQADPTYCGSNGECANGQICVNNHWTSGCCSDSDCSDPRPICRSNQCDWICTLDRDCDDGFKCDQHICVLDQICGDREFQTMYFDFDESLVRADQESRLEDNYNCLVQFPDDDVLIAGHCDERGTEEYNLALGERRARSAKRYLNRMGVDNDRMDIVSYGESRPVSTGHNESAWRQNRRSDFNWR